jgi:hypothetical protein
VRPSPGRGPREFKAGKFAGHDEIGEKQIHPLPLHKRQSGRRVFRLQHVISEFARLSRHDSTQGGIVFDGKDDLTVAKRDRFGSRSLGCLNTGFVARQIGPFKSRSASFPFPVSTTAYPAPLRTRTTKRRKASSSSSTRTEAFVSTGASSKQATGLGSLAMVVRR